MPKLRLCLALTTLAALACASKTPAPAESPAVESAGPAEAPAAANAAAPAEAPAAGKGVAPAEAATTGQPAEPKAVNAATPEEAAAAAAAAANSPPAGQDDEEYPGVSTDLTNATAMFWARVDGDYVAMWRKPKPDSGSKFIFKGGVVEVLADRGPVVTVEGRKLPTVPIRFAGERGWTPVEGLRRLPEPPADAVRLWALLAKRPEAAAASVPADCRAGMLAVDFVPGGAEELLVFSAELPECRRVLGLFGVSGAEPRLLGVLSAPEFNQVRTRTWGNGEAVFLDVKTYFMAGMDLTGEQRTFYLWSEGKPSVAFHIEDNFIDARAVPVKYLMSSFAFPDPAQDGKWLVQRRKTIRIVSEGKETDEAKEEFYRFDGKGFAPVERPAGVADLPPAPPTSVLGNPAGDVNAVSPPVVQ